MKIKNILLIITAITIVSCNDARKSETYRLLEDVESYMEERPDNALAVLESIGKNELASKELEAKQGLLKWFTLMKVTKEVPEYETLQVAYDYYTGQKPSREKLLVHLYRGICFIKAGEYENAMIEFIKAEDNYDYGNAVDRARLHSYKGSIHKRHYDYPSTIAENLIAAEIYLEADLLRQYYVCIEEIMDCHIMNNDMEAASEYLSIAEEYLKYGNRRDFHDFHITKAKIISRKYGHDACADMLDEYLSKVTDEKDVFNWRIIAYMYHCAGRHEKALECIEKDAEYRDVTNDQNHYYVLAEIKKALRDYKGSVEAYEKTMQIDSTSERGRFTSNAKLIEERHDNEIKQLKVQNQRNTTILLGVIVFLVLTIIIWHIRNRLKQRTVENKELAIEKERYEHLYRDAMAEHNALTRMIEENTVNEDTKAIIERRLELLNKVIVSYITDTSAANRKANEELEALVSDRDMFITSTRMTLESSHPAFFRYLREKELTDWEINYCCLYLIGLKGKDIGEYINLKRHYTYGCVIRQKLGLTENDTNLSIHLKKLIENHQA